jgi:SWI/SNF-related matrix-associated actin-dependent regulator of chromatin subfamily A-like protein 1
VKVVRGANQLFLYGVDTAPVAPIHDLPIERGRGGVYTASIRDEGFLRTVWPDADWPPTSFPPPDLGKQKYGGIVPHEYQRQVLSYGNKLFIADDPGLGKTIEALMYLIERGLPAVVVYRLTAAQTHWEAHARTMGVDPIVGKLPSRAGQIGLFHYEALHRIVTGHKPEDLAEREAFRRWSKERVAIVLDESHAIKTPTTHRANNVWELFSEVPFKVLLSATPVKNRRADLWPQLAFLDPERFADWPRFAVRYCDGKTERISTGRGKPPKYVLVADGASHQDELSLRLKSILLRRSKWDVKLELPPVTRTVLPVEVDDPAAEEEFRSATRAGGVAVGVFSRYRAAMARGKVAAVADWLSGRSRTVVFTSFATAAQDLAARTGALLLDGSVAQRTRPTLLTEFAASGRNLVATTETGGESLNLQSANTVAFLDLPWTPAEIAQAEERVWRQGQQSPVYIVYFVSANSAEEQVVRVLLAKETRNEDWAVGRDDILRQVQQYL